nr:uncharacterized protein LOC129528492 [Gorilla gorilla gorilla]
MALISRGCPLVSRCIVHQRTTVCPRTICAWSQLAGSRSTAPGGLATYKAVTGLPAAHQVRAAAETLGKCGLPVPAVRGSRDVCPAGGGFWEMWFAVGGALGQSRDSLRPGGGFQAKERFGAVSFPEVGRRYALTSYAARQVRGDAGSGRLRDGEALLRTPDTAHL